MKALVWFCFVFFKRGEKRMLNKRINKIAIWLFLMSCFAFELSWCVALCKDIFYYSYCHCYCNFKSIRWKLVEVHVYSLFSHEVAFSRSCSGDQRLQNRSVDPGIPLRAWAWIRPINQPEGPVCVPVSRVLGWGCGSILLEIDNGKVRKPWEGFCWEAGTWIHSPIWKEKNIKRTEEHPDFASKRLRWWGTRGRMKKDWCDERT